MTPDPTTTAITRTVTVITPVPVGLGPVQGYLLLLLLLQILRRLGLLPDDQQQAILGDSTDWREIDARLTLWLQQRPWLVSVVSSYRTALATGQAQLLFS